MTPSGFEGFFQEKEEFVVQMRQALHEVLLEFSSRPNLLRPKINSCLEDNFGITSRDVSLRIAEDSGGFSLHISHSDHGEIMLEMHN